MVQNYFRVYIYIYIDSPYIYMYITMAKPACNRVSLVAMSIVDVF